MKKVLIITGGSKGIGEGIVNAYLADGFKIYSIARNVNKDLSTAVKQFAFDLTLIENIERLFEDIFKEIDPKETGQITLINNAGTLGEIAPLARLKPLDMQQTVALNLTSVFVSCAIFIKSCQSWSCKKSIINISSGAAQKPYFGWSVYCATKSAIDMLSKNIALEQEEEKHPVKVLSIAPGVVDTGMQAKIRSSSKDNFKTIDRFIQLKEDNQLLKPDYVGHSILQMNQDDQLISGSILRVQ
ncbi:(S)-benzoin forming benzil reductase [Pedobacter montanisoli]|uniref:(S)-benzoin forming benzil reductase n=1 Tax=Pedobacter montanisoli TaxID=2923277 RepID=A0ABS9ZWU6_9SPHI|nr:(S)-benzoin forming benzil reductase [Pedobacter montanisoli]MCJ0742763.1 (S)-benzoin forming benzil reductase [Pedobacter montanisoli]